MRRVVSALMRSGRGSLLGPATSRRVRWWHCTLECGHVVEPLVRYKPRDNGGLRANGYHPRLRDDALPAPKRCRCKECERSLNTAAG